MKLNRYATSGRNGIIPATAIIIMGLWFLPLAVRADVATIDVATTAQLRDAINTVNLGGDPNIDEAVVRLAAGTYSLYEEGSSEDDLNAAGDLDIRPGGNIASLSLEPSVAGAVVILEGAGAYRILDVFPHTSIPFALNINNVSIQNGSADGYGGAMLIHPSSAADAISVTMTGVSIRNNTATASGGAIAIGPGSTLDIRDSTVGDNLTYFNGGGVFCFGGTARFFNTQLTGNQAAPPATGIGGGAVYNAGGTILMDSASALVNNRTAAEGLYGGAMANTGFGGMTVSASITASDNKGSGLLNQFGNMTVNFPDGNSFLRGDIIIIAGSVTFNIEGVLTLLGNLIQPGGDLILNGTLRFPTAMPWIPLLLLND